MLFNHILKTIKQLTISLFFIISILFLPITAQALTHPLLGMLPDKLTYHNTQTNESNETVHLTQNNIGQLFINNQQIPDSLIATLNQFAINLPPNLRSKKTTIITGALMSIFLHNDNWATQRFQIHTRTEQPVLYAINLSISSLNNDPLSVTIKPFGLACSVSFSSHNIPNTNFVLSQSFDVHMPNRNLAESMIQYILLCFTVCFGCRKHLD